MRCKSCREERYAESYYCIEHLREYIERARATLDKAESPEAMRE